MWLAKAAAVATCIALSWKRLKKQDYVDPMYLRSDEHRNIRRSLNIFYGLVLAQGILIICMLLPLSDRRRFIARMKYRLSMPSGRKIINLYERNNYLEFIAGNVGTTLDMALITFAKNLAVSSTVDGQLLGVRAMDRILRTVEDQHIRGHAARVLVKLTPDILVQTCPQILPLLSSSLLLLPSKEDMDFDLIWFGLRILDKLMDNPDNCRQAANDDSGGFDLLSTIIDLTNLCAHGGRATTVSDSWIEREIIPLLQKEDDIPPPLINKIDKEIIASMALNILSKLVAAPGTAGVKLREEASKNVNFLTGNLLANTGMILEHVQASRVISCLAVDKAYMKLIDGALPTVFKAVVDAVATLEDPSSAENLDHVKDDLWVKQGKVLESFIGLAVQICRSPNATSDFSTALEKADLNVVTLVNKLKKILEMYRSPSTDFPCIRVSTLELITWMVEENSSYREIVLQCGVYEELKEVARTARKLESFKLFHCGVGVPPDGTMECISSLATKLQEKLQQSPNFDTRYRYGEHASRISVLIA
uniref:Uncharacterized protein n=1 Tax=Oryza meridionalis TaxID=40149 RepID=A0A0E0DLR4_9ORYZ